MACKMRCRSRCHLFRGTPCVPQPSFSGTPCGFHQPFPETTCLAMVKEGTAMKAMKAMKSVMKHKLKDNRLK